VAQRGDEHDHSRESASGTLVCPTRTRTGRDKTEKTRRISSQDGKEDQAKAIVATARKIAERVYRMLKFGQEYVRQSQEAYEQAYQLRLMKSLAKRAAAMGYKLVPETIGT
jgi:hypothetical protein